MSANNAFTPAEDAALAHLLHYRGADWKLYLGHYTALADRSATACEKHLWHVEYFGLGGTLREAVAKIAPSGVWPEPGVRLFFDDPRAEADHGSPGFRF